MSIVYAAIAKDSVVLSEHCTVSSAHIPKVVRAIIERIPTHNHKKTYSSDRFNFHYLVDDGYTYLCVADQEIGARIAFAFLEAIKTNWTSSLTKAGFSNENFCRILQQQMEFYSKDPSADKVRALHTEINKVKEIVLDNLDQVLHRGEKIEELVDKTEKLNTLSVNFQRKSVTVKRKYQCKNRKLCILISVIGLIVVFYGLLAVICRGPLLNSCISFLFNPNTNHSQRNTTIVNLSNSYSFVRSLQDNFYLAWNLLRGYEREVLVDSQSELGLIFETLRRKDTEK